ncbi:MAG: hypothetical protein LM517_00085 [Nitrosomonas sp.]|nr:hypothetical protein [Nitrosomonas sp.]
MLIDTTALTPSTVPNLKEPAIMLSSLLAGNEASVRSLSASIACKLPIKRSALSAH